MEVSALNANQHQPTAGTMASDASRRVVSPEGIPGNASRRQVSPPVVRRLVSPLQGSMASAASMANGGGQVVPAWGTMMTQSLSSQSTTSWPGGPSRHAPQHSQAPGCDWATSPRNVTFNAADGNVATDEVMLRQASTTGLANVSSVDRLITASSLSRDPSPEQDRSCSADRHAAGRAEILREALRDVQPAETLSNVARGLSPRAKNVGAPPPVGKSGRMAMRSGRQDSLGSRMRMGSSSSPRASKKDVKNERVVSPREDRIGLTTPARSNSQADLRGSTGSGCRAAVGSEDASTVMQLRREMDEMRNENSRLQEKLAKARSMVLSLQKQVEEARSERDREHRRAEGLQLSAQQLQRQLRRETAKANSLERSSVSRGDNMLVSSPSTAEVKELLGENSDPAASMPQTQDLGNGTAESTELSARTAASSSASTAATHGHTRGVAALGVEGVDEHLEEPVPEPTSNESNNAAGGNGTAASLERTWEFVVQGKHDDMDLQGDFAHKLVSCFPDDAIERAWSRGVACVCSRGRRLDNSTPNQDDFLIARHTLANNGHIALYGVFDGYGPAGHHCASFARGALPESLFSQNALLMKPEETLRRAFQQTQVNLLQQPFDTENSGTTAALALVLNVPRAPSQQASECETWLFVAHVGDSRVLLASQDEPNSFSVTALTRDHRPDDAEEADRIRREGGEVRRLHRNSGAVRVFAVDQDRPASALTRCLGASGSVACGVASDPEIKAYKLRPSIDVLLVLGTDGLFEFCNDMDAVGTMLREGVEVSVLEEVCNESRKQWASSSYNETVDDITVIAVSLPLNVWGEPP